ncbi:hypothetical protein BC628DRAFT_969002 [Trametes gibbosa]|nr:hypothetical protein BC628DRAFT_969002 [Trametes gibbosa]
MHDAAGYPGCEFQIREALAEVLGTQTSNHFFDKFLFVWLSGEPGATRPHGGTVQTHQEELREEKRVDGRARPVRVEWGVRPVSARKEYIQNNACTQTSGQLAGTEIDDEDEDCTGSARLLIVFLSFGP